MNREEVIKILSHWLCPPYPLPEAREKAKELLNLRYPCRECKESGKIITDIWLNPILNLASRCPFCNGTGKGGRMLAVLDENGII